MTLALEDFKLNDDLLSRLNKRQVIKKASKTSAPYELKIAKINIDLLNITVPKFIKTFFQFKKL